MNAMLSCFKYVNRMVDLEQNVKSVCCVDAVTIVLSNMMKAFSSSSDISAEEVI